MLIGLSIRDVVLIERLDLSFGPGLTVLTGETGGGKSIILDALGLAAGRRGDVSLVRQGADQALAAAIFSPSPTHPVWTMLEARGLIAVPDEELVLRRTLSADGRSRAFVNDQPTTAAVLRETAGLLVEVHGQHEAIGLLDPATHRQLLDAFGGLGPARAATAEAWGRWRDVRETAQRLADQSGRQEAEAAELAATLAELDRLDPRSGEEAALAEERSVLGAAEKTLAEIAAAAQAFGGGVAVQRLAAGLRGLERARERLCASGASPESAAVAGLDAAIAATDRALSELTEAEAAVDAAAGGLAVEPDRLEKVEERLFALRAAARRRAATPDELPGLRLAFADRLRALESGAEALAAAEASEREARAGYLAAAERLSCARRTAAERLARAVEAELPPLRLQGARFQASVEPQGEDRAGPAGLDRVQFEIATNPGSAPGPLADIASGGELSRLSLALKVALSGRQQDAPLMIFDEVDQGIGGAVADAVGQRLGRLAGRAQVIVVTHSPQIAARAEGHWRVRKAEDGAGVRTLVEPLAGAAREEEIARMLAGAEVTEAARAAARALMHA